MSTIIVISILVGVLLMSASFFAHAGGGGYAVIQLILALAILSAVIVGAKNYSRTGKGGA